MVVGSWMLWPVGFTPACSAFMLEGGFAASQSHAVTLEENIGFWVF